MPEDRYFQNKNFVPSPPFIPLPYKEDKNMLEKELEIQEKDIKSIIKNIEINEKDIEIKNETKNENEIKTLKESK